MTDSPHVFVWRVVSYEHVGAVKELARFYSLDEAQTFLLANMHITTLAIDNVIEERKPESSQQQSNDFFFDINRAFS